MLHSCKVNSTSCATNSVRYFVKMHSVVGEIQFEGISAFAQKFYPEGGFTISLELFFWKLMMSSNFWGKEEQLVSGTFVVCSRLLCALQF